MREVSNHLIVLIGTKVCWEEVVNGERLLGLSQAEESEERFQFWFWVQIWTIGPHELGDLSLKFPF